MEMKKQNYIAPETESFEMYEANIIAASIGSGEGEGSHDANSKAEVSLEEDGNGNLWDQEW